MPRGIFPIFLARIYVLEHASGQPWAPANGAEADDFMMSWCAECARHVVSLSEPTDQGRCATLAASFRGEAKEWRIGVDGQPRCQAFEPARADLLAASESISGVLL